jgi:hypothetical protein
MKTNQPTIHELRRQGFKVAVLHKDKTTTITLTNPNGQHSKGVAITHEGDQYNRKIGNSIALGRSLKNMSSGIFCEFNFLQTI